MSQWVVQMVESRENEGEESDAENKSETEKKTHLYCHFETISSVQKL